ncbi:MAG: hypothetical protein R3339_12150 [Thermodesulfobacteriota bacterium]|nr:hypothetical protein [Thermodesulfobacteriota bacterium]
MGRLILLAGIGIVGYSYYTHTTDAILSLVAFICIAFGAIFYFFTSFR